jgi:acyl-CoA thioesterase I
VASFLRFFLVCALMAGPSYTAGAARILFLGDSLTEGYGIAQEDAFPALVEQSLRKDGYTVEAVNGGVSGSTTASAPGRLRWHLKAKPDILVLALGANDGLRGIPPAEIRKNLIATLDIARQNKLKILLVGMKMPPNYGAAYAQQFEAIFPELAKRYAAPLVPFMLDRIAGEPDLNLADGIHPNEKGHRLMAEVMTKALKPFLKAGV